MASVFWISCAIVVYVYVGYPALLLAWVRLRSLDIVRLPRTAPPGVSIVMAARNEGQRLAKRIENLLRLEYGGDRQIIVVSDGSTDNTLEVLANYRRSVDIVAVDAGGKAVALNAGVARARHDIIVFADARQEIGRAHV